MATTLRLASIGAGSLGSALGSSARAGCDGLGDVGGCIVGEVLVGIISQDPASHFSVDPTWEPTLPRHEQRFRQRDLLLPA